MAASRLLVAVADLVRLAGVVSLVWVLIRGEWVNAALFSLVLLGLVVPRILATLPLLDLGYVVLVLFAAWSAVLDLYVRYDWLDVVVHASLCGLTAFVAHRLLVGMGALPQPDSLTLRRPHAGLLLTTAALGLALGTLWEMGEWFGHTCLDDRIQVGYRDTMGDLTADGLGALATGLVLARTGSRQRRTARCDDRGPSPVSVCVVIPVKDDAVALERCLRLLSGQTVAPAEVVVVDNACVDDSVDVALRYGARVVVEPRPGIPAAAAAGYDATAADVIARCDADTVPPPDWVERITRAMTADPRLDALTGGGWFYDLPRWLAPLAGRLYLGAYYVLVHAALGHTPVWGSNMALRTSTWSEVRHLVHLDAELHDDIDLAFALGPRRRVRYERRLSVGVSARSLRGRGQLRRRLERAGRTLELNWRVVPPWLRWRSRILAPHPGGPADTAPGSPDIGETRV